eukprot:gene18894-24154_t
MGSGSSQQVKANFDLKTTSDQIMLAFGDNAKNKHVIVTGANCGLGFETAKSLACGSTVTVACRKKEDGDAAVAKIKKDYPEAK